MFLHWVLHLMDIQSEMVVFGSPVHQFAHGLQGIRASKVCSQTVERPWPVIQLMGVSLNQPRNPNVPVFLKSYRLQILLLTLLLQYYGRRRVKGKWWYLMVDRSGHVNMRPTVCFLMFIWTVLAHRKIPSEYSYSKTFF